MTSRAEYVGGIVRIGLCISLALSGIGMVRAHAADILVSIDRTTQDWSDLGMGAPTAVDDADLSQNPYAAFTYVPSYGKPHAEAGARGINLPRLNDGKFPANGDDTASNIWFDTTGNSRILVDLGASTNISRINVYSWHSGALSPQQYTLWASDRHTPLNTDSADLSGDWQEITDVNTFSLGEGGKHGSSINVKSGMIGRYRYLLFDMPANRPDWSRSGFISEIDVYKVGRELDQVKIVTRKTGSQTLTLGDIYLAKPLKEEIPFLVAGPKLYEYGAMDGTFPSVGRLDGDQGGIWCHPIKIMNKLEYQILEEGQSPLRLLGSATQFVHEFASCMFHFNRNDLKITRQDFVPEDEPALFSFLTLRNETDRTRKLDVWFSGAVNIRPSYASGLPNGRDVVSYRDGLVSAFDSDMASNWGVVFGSNTTPSHHSIEGNHAALTYPVTLPAHGETTLHLLILGEHEAGVVTAQSRFRTILGQATEKLTRKQTLYTNKILGGVKFDCSDKAVSDAFTCAKANVMMSVMDLRPGYPAPFLAAGFPIYTWLFGCDSLYSTAGVAAGGFDKAARGTLECLLHYADQKKQGAHEVASNGRLLGWDHIQETPQLVFACWKYFQWTGDMDFLKRAYPVCKESIAQVLASADRDNDAYLEGPGLMEQAGMGPERIASACYLYAAHESLAAMADILQEKGAADHRRGAVELKQGFNRDWWNSKEKMWACSLWDDHKQTMDNFWAVCFPQEVGIADIDKALVVLDRIENAWVNDQWGFVAQWKPDITGEGVGVVHNNILALTAFMYGKADLGWKLMKLSARAPLEARMLGAFDETTPGGGDIMQLWSFGPYLEAIISGLVGVHPVASEHKVELYPHMPRDLSYFTLRDVEFGEHMLDVDWQRDGEKQLLTFSHTKGSMDLQVVFRIAKKERSRMKLNGRTISPEKEELRGVMTEKLTISLSPGDSRTVLLEPEK